MSRRRSAEKRLVIPDVKYGSKKVAKFMNYLMRHGKKSIAEGIVYKGLEKLSQLSKMDAVEAFNTALDNVRPKMEVRSRRIGGATYQVPVDVRDDRAMALSIRWVVAAAQSRPEKVMEDRLASELFDAFNQRGSAFKKKVDTEKMAESNRAFAHYKIN
jgi:small subunit ribosomal protein S7